MKTITRRQKQEALALWKSRQIPTHYAFKFIGWMQANASREAEGIAGVFPSVSCGRALTEFVHEYHSEISSLPLL